jgi:outer membrane protein TolC
MPILNAELAYNKRIKQEQVSLQALEVQLYKRELVKEIKLAYLQYLQSLDAIQIYQSALTLVKESKRVNTALFENDKVNRTVLLRANNEVVKYEASKQQAEKQSASARAFFNFLLNRPLTDSIKVDQQFSMPVLMANNALAVTQREEWLKLKVADKINHELSGLAKSVVTPKISGFVDLGSQSFDWKFNDQSRYYFMGISLQWNLFTSGKNSIKVKQTILDDNILKAQNDNILQQLELKLSTSLNDYYAAIANYTAANASLKTAQTYATDMMKLYKEGQALYIELLDAQNQLIQTKIQSSITLYNTHMKYAEIERATASFNLN